MAEDVHYFSNGTEGDIWRSAWCDNCAAEHAVHEGADPGDAGCTIILAMLVGEAHSDLTVDDRWAMDPSMRVRCRSYQPCPCPIHPQRPDVPLAAVERRTVGRMLRQADAMARRWDELAGDLAEWIESRGGEEAVYGVVDDVLDLPAWACEVIWGAQDARSWRDGRQRLADALRAGEGAT